MGATSIVVHTRLDALVLAVLDQAVEIVAAALGPEWAVEVIAEVFGEPSESVEEIGV